MHLFHSFSFYFFGIANKHHPLTPLTANHIVLNTFDYNRVSNGPGWAAQPGEVRPMAQPGARHAPVDWSTGRVGQGPWYI